MNDLIVLFAVLWGIKLAECNESERYELRQWGSDELLELFTCWTNEYMKGDEYDDAVDFFNERLEQLLNKENERHETK